MSMGNAIVLVGRSSPWISAAVFSDATAIGPFETGAAAPIAGAIETGRPLPLAVSVFPVRLSHSVSTHATIGFGLRIFSIRLRKNTPTTAVTTSAAHTPSHGLTRPSSAI